jgi:hypothetical protein
VLSIQQRRGGDWKKGVDRRADKLFFEFVLYLSWMVVILYELQARESRQYTQRFVELLLLL